MSRQNVRAGAAEGERLCDLAHTRPAATSSAFAVLQLDPERQQDFAWRKNNDGIPRARGCEHRRPGFGIRFESIVDIRLQRPSAAPKIATIRRHEVCARVADALRLASLTVLTRPIR